jgi:hypothetical protein
MARGEAVAAGYHLSSGSLQLAVDPGSFQRGGAVEASDRYTVSLADLPLLGWARITVSSRQLGRIDLYRSLWSSGGPP